MSLVEILTTITIVGVLTAGALAAFSRVREGSKNGAAQDLINHLNNCIASFGQTNYEIVLARDDANTDDEMDVLTTLQWRHPDDELADAGSPYVTPYWDPAVSSDDETYRIRWNGKVFELLKAGTAGSGIKIDFTNGADGTSGQGRMSSALSSYTSQDPEPKIPPIPPQAAP